METAGILKKSAGRLFSVLGSKASAAHAKTRWRGAPAALSTVLHICRGALPPCPFYAGPS